MEKGILRTDIPAALKAGLIGAAAGLVVALIGRIPHVSIGTATCVCIATLRIEELIQTLKAKYTIVVVMHNMQQAARASDHIAFLMMAEGRAGHLVEFEPTQQILTAPPIRQPTSCKCVGLEEFLGSESVSPEFGAVC